MTRETPSLETQLEAVRDWKRIGMALIAGTTAVEQMILAQIAARDPPVDTPESIG